MGPDEKRPQQYNAKLDVVLMREVLTQKINPKPPRGSGKTLEPKWQDVTDKVNAYSEKDKRYVTLRQTKGRAQTICGVDETYDELKEALTDWTDLFKNGELNLDNKKLKEKEKEQKKIAQGIEIRRKAMESLKSMKKEGESEDEEDGNEDQPENDESDSGSEGPPTLTPVRKRKSKSASSGEKPTKKQAMFEYLDEKNGLKRKELEIEEIKAKAAQSQSDLMLKMFQNFMDRKQKDSNNNNDD